MHAWKTKTGPALEYLMIQERFLQISFGTKHITSNAMFQPWSYQLIDIYQSELQNPEQNVFFVLVFLLQQQKKF